MSVWMVDVDADELASAKEVVVAAAAAASSATTGATIETRVVDVSDAGAMSKLADEVFAGGGGVSHSWKHQPVQPAQIRGRRNAFRRSTHCAQGLLYRKQVACAVVQ